VWIQYALTVDRSQVTSHLRSRHRVNQQERRGLTNHLNARYPHGFRNPAEVPLRADGSDIHPELAVYKASPATAIAPSIITNSRSISHSNTWVAAKLRVRGLAIFITMSIYRLGLTAPHGDIGLQRRMGARFGQLLVEV
jgi:hypothetical protein